MKKGQQEMVGFVLIVVLVIVALMIFLIISFRDGGETQESVGASNMLDVILKATTECAIVYEPDYDNMEDLFKHCFKGSYCSNLEMSACNYLNETLEDIINSMIISDATINAWRVDFFSDDGDGILQWSGGDCNQTIMGAQKAIVSSGNTLIIRMRTC